jgi:ribosomal protein S18 acetylase RimI-like enzyme
MDVTLRPATQHEFAAYLPELEAGYAAKVAESGSMPPDKAREKARQDMARALPDGLGSPGQFIYRVLAAGDPVGWLWLGAAADDPAMAWVNQVEIDPAYQGRSYGRQAMLLAEQEARAHGMTSIGLNVHGQNAVARALYESLGYDTRTLQMRKAL